MQVYQEVMLSHICCPKIQDDTEVILFAIQKSEDLEVIFIVQEFTMIQK